MCHTKELKLISLFRRGFTNALKNHTLTELFQPYKSTCWNENKNVNIIIILEILSSLEENI